MQWKHVNMLVNKSCRKHFKSKESGIVNSSKFERVNQGKESDAARSSFVSFSVFYKRGIFLNFELEKDVECQVLSKHD